MSIPNPPDAITDALRQISTLASLDEQQLHDLAAQLHLHHAAPGSCLVELGSDDPRLLLLVDGQLELLAEDGAVRRLRHTDPGCDGPVSRLRPSRYRISATSTCRYVLIDPDLFDSLASYTAEETFLVEETDPDDLPDGPLGASRHPLMSALFDDIDHGHIVVPSDPEIAVRVGRALGTPGASKRHLADALSACPSLTLKAMRSAMHGDGAAREIRSTLQIIERLGAERIYGLTVNCVLRESLRTDSALVRARMQHWWRHTLRTAAIARALAPHVDALDPDYAALIALLHAIAEPVMLAYADRYPDLVDPGALDQLLDQHRAALGHILLSRWQLPRAIVEAAAHVGDWGYDHAGRADYTDLLLAAQWHATIGDSTHPKAEYSDIPALARLGLGPSDTELGQTITRAAESAIERANRVVGAQDSA